MKIKLAIVGVGVTSKYGIGTNLFLDGIISNDNEGFNSREYKVPDFDIKELLGKKVRYINRTTALSLIAMNQVLDNFNPLESYSSDEIGIAVGTNTGSLKVTLDFANDTFLQEKPYFVDPSYFPQGILNYMAGNAAIRYGFEGVNVTLSAGRMTGLEVINYAANAIETSQCKAMLIGTVEDANEYSEYIYHQQNNFLCQSAMGFAEGSVCIGVESLENAQLYGHSIIAEIIDVDITFNPETKDTSKSLKRIIDNLLNKHSITYKDIYAISAIDNHNNDGQNFEMNSINSEAHKISIKEKLGDSLAITNLFQIVSLLAIKQDSPKYCLIYALEDENNLIGCALLKI